MRKAPSLHESTSASGITGSEATPPNGTNIAPFMDDADPPSCVAGRFGPGQGTRGFGNWRKARCRCITCFKRLYSLVSFPFNFLISLPFEREIFFIFFLPAILSPF
jgi:hypothetical protein